MKCKHVLFLLIPLLLSGCFVVRHGRYEVNELTNGWRTHSSRGTTLFKQPVPRNTDWNIVAICTVKGKLIIGLLALVYDPLSYSVKVSNNPIHIILHDKNERELTMNAEQFV